MRAGVTRGERRLVRGGRHGHQHGDAHARQREQEAESQPPGEGGVGQTLDDEQDGDEQGHRPDGDDHEAHRGPERRVQRSADVEVAGGAAHHLAGDDRHLDGQADADDAAGEADEARVAADEAEQPDQGEGVDADRDGELGRLEPGGHAGDHPRIDDQAHQRPGQRQQHRQPDERQQGGGRERAWQGPPRGEPRERHRRRKR